MKRRYSIVESLLIGLLLLLCSAQVAGSQPRVTLAGESRLWIEGSSSVNTFVCVAGAVDGAGSFSAQRPAGAHVAEAELLVPVRGFDCGKARMNKDFVAALKVEAHPQIRFRLNEAELTASANDAGWGHLRVTGRLTIAGTERTVTMHVKGQRSADGTYRATGELPLLMSDFGIDPPTALFGLIKAHDPITVRFDLVAIPQSDYYTN